MGYEFTFQKETTQKWIDDKFGNAGETKTHHLAVNPEWYDPDYKNETTPESQKELERIKQESLDRMKN